MATLCGHQQPNACYLACLFVGQIFFSHGCCFLSHFPSLLPVPAAVPPSRSLRSTTCLEDGLLLLLPRGPCGLTPSSSGSPLLLASSAQALSSSAERSRGCRIVGRLPPENVLGPASMTVGAPAGAEPPSWPRLLDLKLPASCCALPPSLSRYLSLERLQKNEQLTEVITVLQMASYHTNGKHNV